MRAMQDTTLSMLLGAVFASSLAGLVVHELGHVLAAGALGARDLRFRLGWPALQLEATLPDLPGAQLVFVAAGALANVGAAGALWGFHGVFRLAAVVQLVVAASALLPVGTSDGAKLLAMLKAWRSSSR
jgi:hypothetical protein